MAAGVAGAAAAEFVSGRAASALGVALLAEITEVVMVYFLIVMVRLIVV